jgi:predicted transcriptional regulator
MRTTVDIDDRVLEHAKRVAGESSRTLSRVVTEALKAYLASRPKQTEAPFELIVCGKPGGRFPTKEEIAAAEEADDLAGLQLPKRRRRAAT